LETFFQHSSCEKGKQSKRKDFIRRENFKQSQEKVAPLEKQESWLNSSNTKEKGAKLTDLQAKQNLNVLQECM